MSSNIMLGSSAFLVGVTGLVAPLPPPHLPRSRSLSKRSGAAGEGNDGNGFGGFDAGAWEKIPSLSPEVAASLSPEVAAVTPLSSKVKAPPPSSGNSDPGRLRSRVDEQERSRGTQVTSVDVEKLPTFVFFCRASDGRYWREEVVGGGNARVCEAKLHEKMALLSSLEGAWTSDYNSNSLVAETRDGAAVGGGGGGRREGADTVGEGGGGGLSNGRRDSVVDKGVGSEVNSGIGSTSVEESSSSILELSTRDDLLRMLGQQRQGEGPIVVMYHAPWCRNCTYLAPVFRRFAAARIAGIEKQAAASGNTVGDDRGVPSAAPVFYRADVSHPSWVGKRSAVVSSKEKEGEEMDLLHAGSPGVENCDVCGRSGFVPCGECEGKGAVVRSSPDGKHTLAVTCPVCVGYRRLRCPACGGKCYMCD